MKQLALLDTWYQPGEIVTLADCRVFIKIWGVGKPVLVLHGFPTSSYDFSRILPLISGDYKFILFDYPGFGFSDKPRGYPYSLFTYADVAQSLMNSLKIDEFAILSHDIGDSVALELIQRNSLAVDKLIMLNGSVYSIPFDNLQMRVLQKLLLTRLGDATVSYLHLFRKPVFASMLNRILAQPLPENDINAFYALISRQNGHTLYARLMRYMLERWQYQHRWLDALAQHHAPLTLIWGMVDPVATPMVAEYVARLRPDTNYVRLDNIGHYPHWESPQHTAQAVAAALSG